MATNKTTLLHLSSAKKSQYHKDEPIKHSAARCQFVGYMIYNMARYFAIAILIYWANELNIEDCKKFIKHCCACYYISKEPQTYNLPENIRFDLSYCIPRCTDCNYCLQNYSEQDAFHYTSNQCPIDNGYSAPDRHSNSNWSKQTGCDSNISITAMTFWEKSYKAYAIISCIGCGIYIVFLVVLVLAELKGAPNSYHAFLKEIYVFNIIVAELCLYAIFKPFQYWDDSITIDDNGSTVVCQVDAIGYAIELIFEYVIGASVLFAIIHLFYMIYQCVCCIWNIDHNAYEEDMDDNQSDVTVTAVAEQTERCNKCKKCYRCSAQIFVLVFLPLAGIFLFWSIFQMTYAGFKNKVFHPLQASIIFVVILLVSASTFDIFVWFKWCYDKTAIGMKTSDLCVIQSKRCCPKNDYSEMDQFNL